MTARKAKAKTNPNHLEVSLRDGETPGRALASRLVHPFNRHGLTSREFHGRIAQRLPEDQQPGMGDFALELREQANAVASGDLRMASDLLLAQAVTLDGIFTEMARLAGANMTNYMDAGERFMRLALKAQANSRATLDALARLHQPREQTVRHVHVNEGGQAVIADQFHHHAGGHRNAETAEQPHATGAAGSGPAMLGHDAQGNGLPIPGGQGAEQVPNARRQGKRRAQGQ